MKNKPIYFYLLSFFLVLVAASFPIQLLFEYDYALTDFWLAWRHLTFINYAVMLFCLIVVYDSLVVSQRLKFTSCALVVLTLFNNGVVGYMAINYSFIQTLLASLLFVIPFMYLLKPSIRPLLLNSSLHWWKTPRRFERNWLVKIDGFESLAKSLNISRSGVLIKLKTDTWNESEWKQLENTLALNSQLPITIHMGNQSFANKATIVRQNIQSHTKEVYVALKFNPISVIDSFLLEQKLVRNLF